MKKNLNKLTQYEKIIFVNLKLLWSRDQNYYSDWHGKWKMDGGVLAQQGIHYVDILFYLFGKPMKCVSLMDNKINKLQQVDNIYIQKNYVPIPFNERDNPLYFLAVCKKTSLNSKIWTDVKGIILHGGKGLHMQSGLVKIL